jgi:hypothetical protein
MKRASSLDKIAPQQMISQTKNIESPNLFFRIVSWRQLEFQHSVGRTQGQERWFGDGKNFEMLKSPARLINPML